MRSKTMSQQKIEANRQNALKSTGPKTPIGKAYSRRNSLKHGLLAKTLFTDFPVQKEEPDEFVELAEQLHHLYKPVGKAEELEVERITFCWWRFKRAARYENAEIHFELGSVAIRGHVSSVREIMNPTHRALTSLLGSATTEIEATGAISAELREKIFAVDPTFFERWAELQAAAKQQHDDYLAQEWRVSSAVVRKVVSKRPKLQAEHAKVIMLAMTKFVIESIVSWSQGVFDSILNMEFDRHAIPNRDALDKLLRYETAIERNLSRALDRLDRLQRRRKGELIPPSVNVHLSQ